MKSWGEKHVCFSLPGSRATIFLCHARWIKPIMHDGLSERWTTRSLFFCLLSSFPTFPLLPFSSVPFSSLSLCFPLVSSLPFCLHFRTFQSSFAFCSVCSTVFCFCFSFVYLVVYLSSGCQGWVESVCRRNDDHRLHGEVSIILGVLHCFLLTLNTMGDKSVEKLGSSKVDFGASWSHFPPPPPNPFPQNNVDFSISFRLHRPQRLHNIELWGGGGGARVSDN